MSDEFPEGLGSQNDITAVIRLVTWEDNGRKRIDHVFTVPNAAGTLVERLQFGILLPDHEKEAIIMSLPFSMNGTNYFGPCNSLDHYAAEETCEGGC